MTTSTDTGAVLLPGKSTGALRAFRHRNFRIAYPANLVSNIGTWAQRIAQDWLVLQLTHSPTALGFVTALQFLPTIFFSTWGGLLADRYNKRILLIYTNLGSAISAFILGFLVVADVVQLWHVYLLALVLGFFGAIDAPIRQAFNSELVGTEDLPSAISLNSANFNIGRLLGPALSGFLIQAFGTGPSFIINAVSYLFVIIALLSLRIGQLDTPKPAAKGSQIREAFRYIRNRPDLFWVMAAVFTTATFGLNFQMFMAIMSTQVFHRQAAAFGLLGTALAVGSLSGALISARLERHRTPRKIMLWMICFGLALTVMSFAPNYYSFAALLPVGGVLALIGIISANSYVQTTTEPSLRGRVMGVYLMIFMGGTPLGSSVLGIIAESVGIRLTILVCGAITALAASVFLILVTRSRRSPAKIAV